MVMGGEQGRDQECVLELERGETISEGKSTWAEARKQKSSILQHTAARCSWYRQTCTRSISYIPSAEVPGTSVVLAAPV